MTDQITSTQVADINYLELIEIVGKDSGYRKIGSYRCVCGNYNIPYSRLRYRLKSGWAIERALLTPSSRK